MRSVLEEDVSMPKKYQNGKLQVRRDVARPYYFVRASVTRIDKSPVSARRLGRSTSSASLMR
jgi:hypothetical protein